MSARIPSLPIPEGATTPVWCLRVRCADTAAGWHTGGDPGVAAEHAFERLARARGWGAVVRANAEDNMMRHIDLRLSGAPPADAGLCPRADGTLTVDVKSQKHKSQMQKAGDCDGAVWVELHGAGPYSPGWLRQPDGADLLAFEQPGGGFLMVPRPALQACVDANVDFTARVFTPFDAELKVYARGAALGGGKCDESTLLPRSLIEGCASVTWAA